MPRVTVGITTCESRDPHRLRRDERAPITDRCSFRYIADETDPRFPGHRRFEQLLEFRQRRNSVENNPGAHDLINGLIEPECACALQDVRFVTARNRCPQLLNHFPKTQELISRVFWIDI